MVKVTDIKWERYYPSFEIFLLIFSASYFMNDYLKLKIHPLMVLLSTIVLLFMVQMLVKHKKNPFLYGTMVMIVIGIGMFLYEMKIVILVQIKDFIHWFMAYQFEEESYDLWYALTIFLLITLLISIMLYLSNQAFITKVLMVVLTIGFLIILTIKQYHVSRLVIGPCLCYALCVITDGCNLLWNPERNQTKVNASTFILPFCIIITLCSVLLPSNKEPISWKFITNVADKLTAQVENAVFDMQVMLGKKDSEFTLHYNGYSGEDNITLGGNLNPSDEILLKLSRKQRAFKDTYLMGSISNKYTGDGWVKEEIPVIDDVEEYKMEFYEVLNSLYLSKLTLANNERLYHTVDLTVKYNKIKTKSLFWTIGSAGISQEDRKKVVDTKSSNITFDGVQKKGLMYTIKFIETNYSSDTFIEYMRSLDDFQYTDTKKSDTVNFDMDSLPDNSAFKQISKSVPMNDVLLSSGLNDIFMERAQIIKNYYTNLPSTVPKRVYDLAEEITKDYDTKYDKLKAIETYLLTYKYTTSPKGTPGDVDFVDYFLFESKEGYCSYFATAMAVLGRCIGIPTRYVEGLAVDYNNKVNSTYLVSSSRAHGWIDAYIEGYGWITFDPTPGYHEENQEQWYIEVTQANNSTAAVEINNQGFKDENNVENNLKINLKNGENSIMSGLIKLVTMIIIIYILYIVGLTIKNQRNYRRVDNNQKVTILYEKILYYLKKDGYGKLEEETLLEYVTRIGEKYNTNNQTLRQVTNIFMEQRYGNADTTVENLFYIQAFMKDLDLSMKEKIGLAKWLILKFKDSIRK